MGTFKCMDKEKIFPTQKITNNEYLEGMCVSSVRMSLPTLYSEPFTFYESKITHIFIFTIKCNSYYAFSKCTQFIWICIKRDFIRLYRQTESDMF